MPVITPQARGTLTSQTSDAYQAPMKTIMANTKAASMMTPFTAPDPTPKAEVTEAIEENGQEATTIEEVKTPEAVTLSPQLTALARREQKFRQQEQAFKAEKAEFAAKQTEVAGLADLKGKLANKDYSALEELGVTYEEFVQYKLNQGDSATPEAQAYKKLEDEINGIKSSQKQNEEKQYEATVSQYRNDIKALVAKDPQFESIKELGAEDHVLQHILDTFEQDGEVLSVDEAAKEVEEALMEEAMRMSNLTKVKAKSAPAKAILPPPQKASPSLKTLTQQIAPQTPKTFGQFQHLSPKERLAQALAKSQRTP